MGLTVLDASIVIAVLDADDPHHDGAREVLEAALASRDSFVVPASAYAEALVGPIRRGSDAVMVLERFLEALPVTVEPATRDIARRAAELRAAHGGRIRLPDAFVIGTAISLGADRILTADHGWPPVGVAVEIVA